MMEDQAEKTGDDAYRHADPAVDQALEWFVRLTAGEAVDDGARARFDAWLHADAAHRAAWEEVSALWSDPEILVVSQQIAEREEAAAAVVALPASRFSPPRLRAFAVALAATLVLAVAASQMAGPLLARWQADYLTGTGETREVRLPDGSRMVLNARSAVALDFEGGGRGVRILEGEAWFDVVHDASWPFHVAGQFSDVRVRGTTFTVRTGDDGDRIALSEGAVEAVHENPGIAAIRLKPGEMVQASETAISAVSRFESDETLGWLEGRIIFSGKPLRAALAEIGHYLGGRVVVLNRDILDVAVSGNYRIDSAEAAVAGVVAAAGGKITRLPGGILIIR